MPENPSNYSHPDSPVRHSYPVAVTDAGIGTAIGLCLRTSPFILMRLGVLVAFTVAAVVWLAFCGGIAYLFSGKNHEGGGGVILFLIGFGLPAGLYYWLRQYILYLLKLGHIAVLTRFITGEGLPEGVNQVQYGKQIVTERFGETNVLFAVDSLVKGIANAFNRTLDFVAGFLPIPGLDSVMEIVHRIVKAATTYLDETIFSYNLARGDENVWRSSADGLVYYAQNAKPVLKTAVWCVVLEYVLTFVIFLVMLVPCWLLARPLPDSVSSFAWVFAILLAGAVRSALLRPLFLTMVATTFHKHAQNQEINPQYSSMLSQATDKFQELTQKANEWVHRTPAQTTPGIQG